METEEAPPPEIQAVGEAWFTKNPDTVAKHFDVDPRRGLDRDEAARRLQQYGPNSISAEPSPSLFAVMRVQVANPMNIMLLIVAAASFAIGQIGTGILIGLLALLNVTTGANQELKAQASVDALADLQVPNARVRRGGSLMEIEATEVVPGDIFNIEAGDFVPADGRIVRSASLEVQEADLTGESAPVAKDPTVLARADTELGDRTNLVFQNTSVTRGSATVVVTATGEQTQIGQIAGMVSSVERKRSPLQRQLDGITKFFGALAWGAVAIIIGAGVARGTEFDDVVLLGVATAISAIPTGLPTFVQAMLSSGARRLADQKAVVKSLTDVETLGGTTAINSDKTGTLTLNQMTATEMFTGGSWYRIEGSGYSKTGAILKTAGDESPDFENLGLGLALCSDATVADDGTIVGDPTEAALVVLAAKVGVDAEDTRFVHPRVAEVPFDSAYKFMATFHESSSGTTMTEPGVSLVKGAPDVVLGRCSHAMWHGEVIPADDVRDAIIAANKRLSERGLRVLSFAVRGMSAENMRAVSADPMAFAEDLIFVSLVGIIDPLRPEAKEAVRVALGAGIDVRMITGDHPVTARAIADDLGLGLGVLRGSEFQKSSDQDILDQLPDLHVLGRVAPEDKLRLARIMQESGEVVAMTGDAVNDAAALKQADIGVAMGSGSEVTKQAAKMILTDDNFSTLVTAVELGRDIYRRIASYVRLQITVLSSVLLLMLLATVFNVNGGVALTPLMLLFAKMGVVAFSVVALITDVPDPGVMEQPPRDPKEQLVNKGSTIRWFINGFIVAVSALLLLIWGPDEPSTTGPSISMTMAFASVALAATGFGLTMRRRLQPAWAGPLFPYLGWIGLGALTTWLAVELPVLQRVLGTVSLTGSQWLIVLGVSMLAPVLVEADKAVQRRKG